MKNKSLIFDTEKHVFTYISGAKRDELSLSQAEALIQPSKHIFISMRESIPYTIESLTNGQLTNYIRIIEKYTSQDLIAWTYMDAHKHLPRISEDYKNDYSQHYIALIYIKILRKERKKLEKKGTK